MVVVRRPPSSAARRLAAALLGVSAAVALTAAACSEPPKDISVGNASRADVTEVVDASATVTAKGVATLTAPADGTLTALSVQPGQTVAAGQVLAVVASPTATARLSQARDALTALNGGGGGGFSTGNLLAVQKRSEQDAAQSFKQARDQAGGVADERLRSTLLAQIDAAEKAYRNAAAGAREVVNSVQRGFAGIGQAMSALTAAQRIQAQSAYDVAKSTVDALTLTAPIAGVVQLGGPGTGSAGPSLTDLLGAAGGAGALPGAAAAGSAATAGGGGAAPSTPGVDSAILPGTRVSAGTPVVT